MSGTAPLAKERPRDVEDLGLPGELVLDVADIVRCAGQSFIERSRKWISWQHQKVLLALSRCRTAALGGHRDQCSDCGHSAISYNSCRNRHCPRCQGNARLRWLQARARELLPTSYVHEVFTLPRELAPLALQNKRLIYNLLFAPAPKPCCKSPAIPATGEPRSVSSACSIPGTSDCNIIPMSTACWPPAVSRRHFQQQAGHFLRGQRNLSLARLRSRQQEAADDSTRRRVPTPLP
jgi:hypothetical protein